MQIPIVSGIASVTSWKIFNKLFTMFLAIFKGASKNPLSISSLRAQMRIFVKFLNCYRIDYSWKNCLDFGLKGIKNSLKDN